MAGRWRGFPSLMLALALIGPSDARGQSDVDRDLVFALRTANRFLCAWQMREQDDGLSLLSPALKRRRSEDDLRSWISGLSNPHNEAFEVGPPRRLRDGRVRVPVKLYEHYTGERMGTASRPLAIVLVKTGPETWLVDELP